MVASNNSQMTLDTSILARWLAFEMKTLAIARILFSKSFELTTAISSIITSIPSTALSVRFTFWLMVMESSWHEHTTKLIESSWLCWEETPIELSNLPSFEFGFCFQCLYDLPLFWNHRYRRHHLRMQGYQNLFGVHILCLA